MIQLILLFFLISWSEPKSVIGGSVGQGYVEGVLFLKKRAHLVAFYTCSSIKARLTVSLLLFRELLLLGCTLQQEINTST
jgi:hypothetical protein